MIVCRLDSSVTEPLSYECVFNDMLKFNDNIFKFNKEKDLLSDIRSVGSAVALGRFDAIHTGHVEIIKSAVDYAKSAGIKSVVFMFENEPSEVVSGKKVPAVNSSEQRREILQKLGVDAVVEKRFDKEFMNLDCQEFIDGYLVDMLGAKYVSAGFNYHFGKGGTGDTALLRKLCKERGIKAYTAKEVTYMGTTVSSTRVRNTIALGDMETVKKLMGREFEIRGTVIEGNRIGTDIGFATANIPIPDGYAVPKCGVYITAARLGGRMYPSITNVGARPTVNEKEKCIETHIIGESFGELYGERISVRFFKLLRETEKFSDISMLVGQLEEDKKTALKYFAEKL